MVSAGAWHLVSNNYETGMNLCFILRSSLTFIGFSGVVLTDSLI